MTSPCLIVVLAKAPVAGYAKTRLIPALGAQGAADLALRFLVHTVEQALDADLGAVELCCAPTSRHPAFGALARRGLTFTDQVDGDLGARMARAIDRGLGQYDKVLLIGTDAPTLDAAILRSAAAALDRHDAVFVPALDGGYVLVGLRRMVRGIFEDMPWGTPLVMQRTRERLAQERPQADDIRRPPPGGVKETWGGPAFPCEGVACGITHAELAALPDIDEAADLVHLPKGWL